VVLPGCEIGRGARLHRCIVAENCKIPDGLSIGESETYETDTQWFHRTPGGVTTVTPETLSKYLAQRNVRMYAADAPRPRARTHEAYHEVA
jgi:glucose-1-phosphate adenylyltransferase